MRARAFSLSLLLSVVACGGDRGEGPPTTEDESPANVEAPSAPEQPEPEIPGICRALCCSDADCPSGATCTPFETASGTLGVCDSDAAPISDGTSFTPACWSAEPAAECNPLTGQGCAEGNTCDYFGGQVSCFGGDNVQSAGAACDDAYGPWCAPGLHCVPS